MGANSLLIVPPGFNPSTGFASYTSLGLTHTAGHHPDRAGRPEFCRRVLDGRPGRLPRDDRRHRRQLDQHEQRTGGLGQRRRQSGRRFPDRQRRDLRPERRLALGDQSICRQGRDRPVHPIRRHEHPFRHAVPRLQLGRQRNLQPKRHGQALGCRPSTRATRGRGNFTQSGGTNSVSGSLYLGYNSGSSGAYALTSAGQLSAATEYVGNSGTGTFTQSAGTNAPGTLYLGANAAGNGSYNLSGTGAVSAPTQYVGNSGTVAFTQSGGTNAASSALYVGYNAGASGNYTISGPASLSAASEYVGYSGTGAFTQSAGTNAVSGSLSISVTTRPARGPTPSAARRRCPRRPSMWATPARERIAQSAGTNAVSGTLYLGYNSTANSTYALSGTGQLTAAGEYVGYNSAATASFQQTGGANTATNLTIGAGGQYLLSGGTLTINGSLVNNGTVNGGNGSATLGGQLPGGSYLRHVEELFRLVRRHRDHRAGDRARRVQRGDRFCRRHHRRPERPRDRHAVDRARRRRFYGRRHDQRSYR